MTRERIYGTCCEVREALWDVQGGNRYYKGPNETINSEYYIYILIFTRKKIVYVHIYIYIYNIYAIIIIYDNIFKVYIYINTYGI